MFLVNILRSSGPGRRSTKALSSGDAAIVRIPLLAPSQMPGRAHGLARQTVGFFVADKFFANRVEAELAPGADGQVGEVDEGDGAVGGFGVAAGAAAGLDRFAESNQGLRLGQGTQLLAV